MDRHLLSIRRDVVGGSIDGLIGFVPTGGVVTEKSQQALQRLRAVLEGWGFMVTTVATTPEPEREG